MTGSVPAVWLIDRGLRPRHSDRPADRRLRGPELWVRTGNSTRQLSVDEANSYVMHRWPLSLGPNLAAQFRAAVRFSEQR